MYTTTIEREHLDNILKVTTTFTTDYHQKKFSEFVSRDEEVKHKMVKYYPSVAHLKEDIQKERLISWGRSALLMASIFLASDLGSHEFLFSHVVPDKNIAFFLELATFTLVGMHALRVYSWPSRLPPLTDHDEIIDSEIRAFKRTFPETPLREYRFSPRSTLNWLRNRFEKTS